MDSKLPEIATYSGSGLSIAASLASQYQPLVSVIVMLIGTVVGVTGLYFQWTKWRKFMGKDRYDDR